VINHRYLSKKTSLLKKYSQKTDPSVFIKKRKFKTGLATEYFAFSWICQ